MLTTISLILLSQLRPYPASSTSLAGIADGGIIASGSSVYCSPASSTGTGCVNTTTQTFSGLKTFSDYLATTSRLYFNEGAAVDNMYISMNGSTVSRYLQFNLSANSWNFAGGTPDLQVITFSVPVTSQISKADIQTGKTAATGGALAVTFARAFSAAPTCTCSQTAAVPLACGITTASNTTSVTFTAGAGTDVINWICIGAR